MELSTKGELWRGVPPTEPTHVPTPCIIRLPDLHPTTLDVCALRTVHGGGAVRRGQRKELVEE